MFVAQFKNMSVDQMYLLVVSAKGRRFLI